MYSQLMAFGRLTRDPELKYVNGHDGQVACCNITVACDDRGGHSGKTHTAFLDFVFWARTGEVIADKLRKGDPILAFGCPRTETWEGRDQEKKSRLRFRGTHFQFVPRSAPVPRQQQQERSERGRTYSGPDHGPRQSDIDDYDIPF